MKSFFWIHPDAPIQSIIQATMNPTTIINNAESHTIVVKPKRKYIRKVKPVLVESESDDDSAEDVLELIDAAVLAVAQIVAKSEIEDNPAVYSDGGEDDDDKSTISTIAGENEEKEEEEECCECCGKFDAEVGCSTGFNSVIMRVCDICDIDGSNYNGWGGYFENEKEEEEEVVEAVVEAEVVEAEVVEDPLPAKMLLPTLESDPVVLRTLVTTLQAEVVRLTAFSQDLQRRVEGVRKQPKTKAAKAEKAVKEGKRKNTRPKRPDDYAQRFLQMGQVLKWTHLSRNAWAEATYIGAGKFRARYSFKDEIDEGLTLNAVSAVMSLHITIHGVNAWSAFKNLDGTSVENLDLVAA